jgi:hypothetical protein
MMNLAQVGLLLDIPLAEAVVQGGNVRASELWDLAVRRAMLVRAGRTVKVKGKN